MLQNYLYMKITPDFSEFWKANKGTENHYSKIGNEKVYKIVVDNIKKIC